MKSIRLFLVLAGFLAFSFPLFAQITANASIAPDIVYVGQSVTIMRDGQAANGIAYCEGTMWAPDGTYDTLAQAGLGPEAYTPHSGAGTYWLQFRLVDNNNDFVDQWISFVVSTAGLTANASVTPTTINYGDSITIDREGQADAGIAYTEGTIWTPDSNIEPLERRDIGTENYTPHNGFGTYWLQFRVVDNTGNFVDQWISFTVM